MTVTGTDSALFVTCALIKVISRYCFLPADVVGLAGGLQLQAVGFLFLLVRADWDDGLTPALGTRRLIADRARAEQHPVAVFGRNLRETKIDVFTSVTYFLPLLDPST